MTIISKHENQRGDQGLVHRWYRHRDNGKWEICKNTNRFTGGGHKREEQDDRKNKIGKTWLEL